MYAHGATLSRWEPFLFITASLITRGDGGDDRAGIVQDTQLLGHMLSLSACPCRTCAHVPLHGVRGPRSVLRPFEFCGTTCENVRRIRSAQQVPRERECNMHTEFSSSTRRSSFSHRQSWRRTGAVLSGEGRTPGPRSRHVAELRGAYQKTGRWC